MKKALGTFSTFLVLTTLVSGCSTPSSTESSVSKPKPAASIKKVTEQKPVALKLTESGYTVVEGPYVEYGFVLNNPNKKLWC